MKDVLSGLNNVRLLSVRLQTRRVFLTPKTKNYNDWLTEHDR